MPADENRTYLVRLFPDDAGTVLWFGGPVPYDKSGLTTDLVRELEEWEQFYHASLTPEYEWASVDATRTFSAEGVRLAQKVADELGSEYVVEFMCHTAPAVPRRFHATRPAKNPEAATAFDALAAQLEADRPSDGESAQDPEDEKSSWRAYAPRAGEHFPPDR